MVEFLESDIQNVNVMTFALDQTFPRRNILQRQSKNSTKKYVFIFRFAKTYGTFGDLTVSDMALCSAGLSLRRIGSHLNQ